MKRILLDVLPIVVMTLALVLLASTPAHAGPTGSYWIDTIKWFEKLCWCALPFYSH